MKNKQISMTVKIPIANLGAKSSPLVVYIIDLKHPKIKMCVSAQNT